MPAFNRRSFLKLIGAVAPIASIGETFAAAENGTEASITVSFGAEFKASHQNVAETMRMPSKLAKKALWRLSFLDVIVERFSKMGLHPEFQELAIEEIDTALRDGKAKAFDIVKMHADFTASDHDAFTPKARRLIANIGYSQADVKEMGYRG